MVSRLLFDADNIRNPFRLLFCVNVVVFVCFVQTSPDFIWCLIVCRFLVVFVACEPFLLSGGVFNCLTVENDCGGFKNVYFGLVWVC